MTINWSSCSFKLENVEHARRAGTLTLLDFFVFVDGQVFTMGVDRARLRVPIRGYDSTGARTLFQKEATAASKKAAE